MLYLSAQFFGFIDVCFCFRRLLGCARLRGARRRGEQWWCFPAFDDFPGNEGRGQCCRVAALAARAARASGSGRKLPVLVPGMFGFFEVVFVARFVRAE